MKAAVYTKYGPPDVISVQEVEKPSPGECEVLVKVQAASVNFSDPTFVRGKPFIVRLMGAGLFKPKNQIPGADVAGTVKQVGSKVTHFNVGDEVFGDLSESGWGGFAEYVCGNEAELVKKPENISFAEAAASGQAAVTALQGLRTCGHIEPGQSVLINGASGGIGTFAIQIAKSLGAEVTGVCSAKNLDFVKSLGADYAIDYALEDFTLNEGRYDMIFDIVVNHNMSDFMRALSPHGHYIACAFNPSSLLKGMVSSGGDGKKVSSLVSKPNGEDRAFIAGLLTSGQIKPAIDRTFPLNETADAIRHYAARHALGKVIIMM